jgi:sugar phosphate isomerase/epimerase
LGFSQRRSADELQRCLDTVAHPNFKIWYDAGNIIHYTGKDPAKELKPIAKHVTGFCAKDCVGQRGEVMVQFGTGKVDFKEVFGVLQSVGFNGPIMVEGMKIGVTPEETNGFAKANREFLEKVLREL